MNSSNDSMSGCCSGSYLSKSDPGIYALMVEEYERQRKSKTRKVSTLYRNKLRRNGCVVCGYCREVSALEFHHIGGDKGKGVSSIKSIVSINKEIVRRPIVILCANCHRELHSGLIDESELVRYRLFPDWVQADILPIAKAVQNA